MRWILVITNKKFTHNSVTKSAKAAIFARLGSRQVKILFMGELCNGIGCVASRFVEEAVFGISSSGSVRLTELGRALEETIAFHATHKRLSRNLADESLEHSIGSNVLKLGSKHINENTLLIVDPSDIQKKYAKKMQYLAQVRDGSQDTIGNGYWGYPIFVIMPWLMA